MIKTILLILSLSATSYAQDLNITSWTFLNRNNVADRAAEVCFQVTPAPESLTPIKVISDYRTNRKGIYYSYVDSDGHACQVVASYTGYVMVVAPELPESPSAESSIIKK